MKQSTSFLKRCAALVMALVLLVSSSNLGVALTVLAGETTKTVTYGELVANNYDLTDAEKNLLNSGILAGGSFGYTVPEAGDNLVAVDTDAKSIEADNYGNWVPTVAKIVVGEVEKETVTLTAGKGNYTFDGNAFSVVVEYVLNQDVDTDLQETLLNTAGWLKDGVANADLVAGQAGNLYILEQAMPELVNLANNGIEVGGRTVRLNDDCNNAINALNDQMTANGGQLELSLLVAAYNSAASKVEYVLTEGTGMKDTMDKLIDDVYWVNAGVSDIYGTAGSLLAWGMITEALYAKLEMLYESVSGLYNGLLAIADTEWVAAGKGTALVKAGITDAEYVALDALVAKIGDTTSVTIKETLLVDETSVRTNLSMWNVNVSVVLNVVKDNAVVVHGTKTTPC